LNTFGTCTATAEPPLPSYQETPYYAKVEYDPDGLINLNSYVAFNAPTNFIDVDLKLTLDGGPRVNGMTPTSQINGMSLRVPEPDSKVELAVNLAALGLVIFGFRRRLARQLSS
jgi:hypothetical protein